MAASDVPVTATPALPASATATSVTATSATAKPATSAGALGIPTSDDFVAMLAELMSTTDASPQAIMSALKSVQVKQGDSQDDPSKMLDPKLLLLDPQALMSLIQSSLAASNASGQGKSDAPSVTALDVNGQRATADLGLLSVVSSRGGGDSALADSLLKSDTTDVGAQNSSPQTTHAASHGAPEAPVSAAPMSNVSDRVVEASDKPQIRASVGTPVWADELAAKLTVMVNRGVHSASLQLSPEQLGPLEIHISVNNDQTSVWFGAAHAETRVALEQALPRLRELLAGQGLNLSDAGVSREAPRDRTKPYVASGDSRNEERELSVTSVSIRGMVDAYA